MREFEQRVCVVTGGGRGIGAAIAEKVLAHGGRVAILERDPALGEDIERCLTRDGGDVKFYDTDVADERSVAQAAERVIDDFGQVNVLVNNAGISRLGPSMSFAVKDFRDSLDVMVTGVFLCCREFGKAMREGGGGVIVNVASINGLVAFPMRLAYSAAKAAVVSMTKVLATEWPAYGIRVNAVAPGMTETEMVKEAIDQGFIDLDAYIARTPLRRFAQPEEIAEAVLYLATDRSSYLTGQVIVAEIAIAAGFMESEAAAEEPNCESIVTQEEFAGSSADVSVNNVYDRLGLTTRLVEQLEAWKAVGRGLRELDPFGRPITVEGGSQLALNGTTFLEDWWNEVDFWFFAADHGGFYGLGPAVDTLHAARAQHPPKPALAGEVNYEGILGSSGPEMQRFLFWSHLLSGAAGHSYGAQGIFCNNTAEYPDGIIGNWGDILQPESWDLPGAQPRGHRPPDSARSALGAVRAPPRMGDAPSRRERQVPSVCRWAARRAPSRLLPRERLGPRLWHPPSGPACERSWRAQLAGAVHRSPHREPARALRPHARG